MVLMATLAAGMAAQQVEKIQGGQWDMEQQLHHILGFLTHGKPLWLEKK